MFLRLPNSDKVISLVGKGLDIIRLPDPTDQGGGMVRMLYALVIVHNTADPPPAAPAYQDPRSKDAYWKKFEVIAECETHDAGEIRLGQPLEPLLDKIYHAIRRGEHLLDLRKEKTYLSLDDVQEMAEKAERQQQERDARKKDAARRNKNFKINI